MPIYEYEIIDEKCDECPGRFEAMQRMSDPALTACPRCGKACRRLITKVAIHTPVTASKLKETGLTRLVRRDHGVYEVEGADSGLLDMSDQLDGPADSDDDDGPVLDLTEELGDHFGINDDPAPQPGPSDESAPLKRGRRQKISLPLYDMLKFEREGKLF